MEEKKALRREMKGIRDGLPLTQRAEASKVIVQTFLQLPQFQSAQEIALFIPFGSEVDITEIFAEAWGMGKKVHVPRVEGENIRFYQLDFWSQCEGGSYGILEPIPERVKPSEITRLGMVLLPGLAFDQQGGRLGYGKGYYDRFLPQIPPQIPRVAVAFQRQVVVQVPTEPQDCTYDWLITEERVYRGPQRV
ncbi:5-formyltetrahydrofolate cyclo-ligase [Rubeoparvulum massiliense]|uniref:5-formyltetrahydrofolate cyclo-ligase n=1 Tax=Rubeoparvulum massiliense TaxID=1631346 RepID=UPI00065DDE2C|nr:5-formyltetrahydrofolate cyclo-ligase [Rubeoparvulum massiliense]